MTAHHHVLTVFARAHENTVAQSDSLTDQTFWRFLLSLRLHTALLLLLLLCPTFGRDLKDSPRPFPLDSAKGLVAIASDIKVVTYRGRRAVQLVPPAGHRDADKDMLAILTGPDFRDGTIEIEVAGAPRAGAPADVRGFIGVAFRVRHRARRRVFLSASTNARCDDQLRRNHSTQYVSTPNYPWERLRKESPGSMSPMSISSPASGPK